MAKLVKAREIKIPSNLPELLDKRAGRKEGTLRNIIIDSGNVRNIEEHALNIAMGYEIQSMMLNPDVPGKPMSIERFRDVLWVLMLAYISGTLHFDDKGELHIGATRDTSFIAKIMESEKFQFRNGKKIPAAVLIPLLQSLTSLSSIKEIYDDIAKIGPIKRRKIEPDACMAISKLVIQSSDKVAEEL